MRRSRSYVATVSLSWRHMVLVAVCVLATAACALATPVRAAAGEPARYTVTLSLSAAQVTAGATVMYSGGVRTAAGAAAAGTVTIQRRPASGGAWSAWRKVALKPDGSYSIAVAMTTADRAWQLRARMPAGGGANLAGVSSVRTLTVTAAAVVDVVEIAQRCLGVPYVWGGASPTGFDCSGLVMYCYAQVGVSLPHGATWQQQACTPVPLDAIQPGDLVFFGSPGAYGHVGIYVGGGTMIDAPHTGAVVRYDPITGAACAGRP
jgi:cell wall-associated NlpC family hydrolase